MSRLPVRFVWMIAIAVLSAPAVQSPAQTPPVSTMPVSSRPTTVPAGWEPRYAGYISDAETMARTLGLTMQQRQIIRDRLRLMTYEMELWEDEHRRTVDRFATAFHQTNSRRDPKGAHLAFLAYDAALAPKTEIHRQHMEWIEETVMTAEQRNKWAAHDLYLHVGSLLETNGFTSIAQGPQVRKLADEATAEIPGKYRDSQVYEARQRRMIDRVRNEVLGAEQARRLDAFLQIREEARAEYEAATRRPSTRSAEVEAGKQ
jgi:hypothetical protein